MSEQEDWKPWVLLVSLPHGGGRAIISSGRVVGASPSLHWAVGQEEAELVRWAIRRGGRVERIEEGEER